MPVAVSMPGVVGRWPTFAFGVLGENNTCVFRLPPCTSHRSLRLFLEWFLRAGNEPLSDDETGIAIRVALHGAVFAEHEGCAWGITFHWLARIVANDGVVTAMTFPARIARVDPTGDDLLVPRLIFGIGEDASLHPESPFAIPASAILALFRLEVTQMLKDENCCPLLLGKLDNTGTHQMCHLLVHLLDLAP